MTSSVCFGALALRPHGAGVSTYERELLTEIVDRLPQARLSAMVQRDAAPDLPPAIRAIEKPVAAGARRAWYGLAPTPRVDVFHGLDVDVPLTGPGTMVSTVHDCSVFDVPWAFSRYRALGERALLRQAIHRADLLIAVSHFTAERIARRFHRDSIVVPLAPARWTRVVGDDEVVAIRAKYGLPDLFIIQIGTVEPRKNVHLVADVARDLGVPLVLAGAGSTGPGTPKTARGLGFVDTDDLPALYRAATVVTYASVYEGFGLPPVEAMACGGAVVASDVGALADVCADGAILVHSDERTAWKRRIGELVSDAEANRELRDNAVRVAGRMSWASTAAQTVSAYRDAGIIC